MNPYRERVWSLLAPEIAAAGPVRRALDFGSGDGWFARQVMDAGLVSELVPIDVKRRDQVFVEPQICPPDGPLPFADGEFDLVYSVDVLHHCSDPGERLREISRVCGGTLVLKDHTFHTEVGRWTLAVLDELGNRRFGIPSPYHYQRGEAWSQLLAELGWERERYIHPATSHTGLLGALTNSLQFVARYRRSAG